MIGKEGDKVLGGEIQHLACRRRPDRGPHRREIVGQQPRGEMMGSEIVAEREPSEFASSVILDALLVEGQDVAQHPEVGATANYGVVRTGLLPFRASCCRRP